MNSLNLENNFYGRKQELALLKRRVLDLKEGYRQNLAFLGSRFIGKTYLLYKFLSDLDDPQVITVYLNCDNHDFSYIYTKFAKSILFNYSKIHQLPQHEDLRLLIETCRPLIPKTVETIEEIGKYAIEQKLNEAYESLISLPEILNTETGLFCLLILDEFHHLADLPVEDVFQRLGSKIMTQKKSLYIVSSSYPELAKEILSEQLTMLFGNFEVVDVLPFDFKMSQEFICYNLRDLKISDQVRNFLADFTGGHPLYISLICHELIHLSAIYKQNEIFIPLLTKALENVIFNQWGVISRHFELIVNELCYGKDNRVVSSLLITLSNSKHKVKPLIAELGIKQAQALNKINYLIDNDILEKNGHHFHYKDKLFRFWIKYVYQKRLRSVEIEAGKQHKQFKEELNQYIEEFDVASNKDLKTRITELLHCFDNESFKLNGRKYKLPLFNEITPLTFRQIGGQFLEVVQANSEDGRWFIVLKDGEVSENDMNIFMSELKKMNEKPQRCIIVSLCDLDESTKVRALQERMWIWNEHEINSLMHLFDKPYVIQ